MKTGIFLFIRTDISVIYHFIAAAAISRANILSNSSFFRPAHQCYVSFHYRVTSKLRGLNVFLVRVHETRCNYKMSICRNEASFLAAQTRLPNPGEIRSCTKSYSVVVQVVSNHMMVQVVQDSC